MTAFPTLYGVRGRSGRRDWNEGPRNSRDKGTVVNTQKENEFDQVWVFLRDAS